RKGSLGRDHEQRLRLAAADAKVQLSSSIRSAHPRRVETVAPDPFHDCGIRYWLTAGPEEIDHLLGPSAQRKVRCLRLILFTDLDRCCRTHMIRRVRGKIVGSVACRGDRVRSVVRDMNGRARATVR